jgi:hypothetical protein
MQCGKEINETAKFCYSCGAGQEIDENDLPPLDLISESRTASMQERVPVADEPKYQVENWKVVLMFFGILMVLIIANTDILKFLDEDQQALKEFEKSTEGQALFTCVGANGSINWRIFKPDNTEPNVRVIEAKLSKRQEKFEIQYFYNLETKVKEIAFMSKDGNPQSKFLGALEFGIFCM